MYLTVRYYPDTMVGGGTGGTGGIISYDLTNIVITVTHPPVGIKKYKVSTL